MDGDVLQKNPLTILFCPFLFPQQWLFSLFSSFSNNAYFRFFQELSGNYNWQFGAIFAKPFRNSIFIISSTFSLKKNAISKDIAAISLFLKICNWTHQGVAVLYLGLMVLLTGKKCWFRFGSQTPLLVLVTNMIYVQLLKC